MSVPRCHELVIAVDAGGTKTVASIATSDGKVFSSKEGCGNSATLGLANASLVILSAIRGALRKAGYSSFVDLLEEGADETGATTSTTPPPTDDDLEFLSPSRPTIKAIWVGSAGLSSLTDITAYRSQLQCLLTKAHLLTPETALWVTNDAVLLSAPMLRDTSSTCCVCLIAGTGSAGFAFQRTSTPTEGEQEASHATLPNETQDLPGLRAVSKTGGWGYLLGDRGSGWSIGLSTVQLLLQRQEERQFSNLLPLTEFEKSVCSSLGVSEPANIIPAAYQDRLACSSSPEGSVTGSGSFFEAEDARKRWLAEISRVVFEYAFRYDPAHQRATSGSDVARSLVDQAIDECVGAVKILCTPMPITNERVSTLVLGGGLWQDKDFLDCFVQKCEINPAVVKFKTVCAIASPVDEVVQYLRESFLPSK